MKTKSITITNMTNDQVAVLREEAAKVGLTVSGLIKLWCQERIKAKDEKQ